MSIPDIALKPLPKIQHLDAYDLTSGDARFGADGNPDGPANDVRWDAALAVLFYDNTATGYGAPTGLTSLGTGVLGTTADTQYAFGYVPEASLIPGNQFQGSINYRWNNGVAAAGTRCLMAQTLFLSECKTGVDTVESWTTGAGAYTGTDFVLPTVTPTIDDSMVIYVMFISAALSASLSAANFSDTPDYYDERDASGSGGTTIIAGFDGCAAGVAVNPTFTRVGTATHWSCVAMVIPPKPTLAVPRVVPGSFIKGSTVLSTPIVLPTSADCDVQYGDILVTTMHYSGSANATATNTSAYDLVLQGTRYPFFAIKRLTGPADLNALAASPPVPSSASGARYMSFLIRGIQRSGTYIYSSRLNTPAGGTSHNLSVTAQAVTDILLTIMTIGNQNYRVQINALDGVGKAVHAWWGEIGAATAAISLQPAGNTGTFNQRWTKISSTGIFDGAGATLISSAPTHWIESAVSAEVILSTVVTAEAGAQYITSSVTAPVIVSTTLRRTTLRTRKTFRPLVWISGYDQVRKSVVD